MHAKRRPSKRKAKPPQEEFTTFELQAIRSQIYRKRNGEPLVIDCPFCHAKNREGSKGCCLQFMKSVRLILADPFTEAPDPNAPGLATTMESVN